MEGKRAATVLAMDETGAAARFQCCTLKVEWYCVRIRRDPQNMVNSEWGPSVSTGEDTDVWPSLSGGRGVRRESLSPSGVDDREVVSVSSSPVPSVVDNVPSLVVGSATALSLLVGPVSDLGSIF